MSENGDKDFYRQMAMEMVNIAKDNSTAIKENNKIMLEQLNTMDEIKIALQDKPCIVKKREEKIHQGWLDSTVKTYRWGLAIAASLFTLSVVSFIVLAFGKEFIGPELTAAIIKWALKMP